MGEGRATYNEPIHNSKPRDDDSENSCTAGFQRHVLRAEPPPRGSSRLRARPKFPAWRPTHGMDVASSWGARPRTTVGGVPAGNARGMQFERVGGMAPSGSGLLTHTLTALTGRGGGWIVGDAAREETRTSAFRTRKTVALTAKRDVPSHDYTPPNKLGSRDSPRLERTTPGPRLYGMITKAFFASCATTLSRAGVTGSPQTRELKRSHRLVTVYIDPHRPTGPTRICGSRRREVRVFAGCWAAPKYRGRRRLPRRGCSWRTDAHPRRDHGSESGPG